MPARPRVFDFAVSLGTDWTARSARGGRSIEREEEWTAEHLLLASLLRCSATSFHYHARRAGLAPLTSASARGVITRRDADGRYAFVEIDVAIDVSIESTPHARTLSDLIAKAERDCFIAASLSVQPNYRWTVNGDLLHGKEGVDGSSPSEGLPKGPAYRHFCCQLAQRSDTFRTHFWYARPNATSRDVHQQAEGSAASHSS